MIDLIDDRFSKIFNIVLPMKTRFEQPVVNIIVEFDRYWLIKGKSFKRIDSGYSYWSRDIIEYEKKKTKKRYSIDWEI